MSLVELFCDVDDFYPLFQQALSAKQLGRQRQHGPKTRLAPSEIMSIIIFFHITRHRDFKTYYNDFVRVYLASLFPIIASSS